MGRIIQRRLIPYASGILCGGEKCRLRNEFRWRDPTGLQDKSELLDGKKREGSGLGGFKGKKSTLFYGPAIRPRPSASSECK